MRRLLSAATAALLVVSPAFAQSAGNVTNHAFAIGKGAGSSGYTSLLCGSAQLAVGQSAADPICRTITGDVTLSAAGATTLATVNSNVGSFGSATQCPAFTVNAKGLITAASATTCTPAVGSVTGLGTGVATFLATPTSANLRAALTDEVGTGAAYFVGGALGTPASGTLTNATGLPLSGLTTQGAFTFVGNNTSGSASPTAVDIAALTTKASPAAGDYIILSDQAASGAWKKASVSSVASAGSVSSIAGNTGAFTLSKGITNSTNDIQLAFNGAVLNATPSDPTGTTSSTAVMMGLGVATCRIASVNSTRLDVTIDGTTYNATAGGTVSLTLRYGTGAGPANGAAATGTAIGNTQVSQNGAGTGLQVGFSRRAILTGLTPGTTYWLDLAVSTGLGTAILRGITCIATET